MSQVPSQNLGYAPEQVFIAQPGNQFTSGSYPQQLGQQFIVSSYPSQSPGFEQRTLHFNSNNSLKRMRFPNFYFHVCPLEIAPVPQRVFVPPPAAPALPELVQPVFERKLWVLFVSYLCFT